VSGQFLIALVTGSGLGLVASTHCVLMCGPLAMIAQARGGGTVRYLAGRFVVYTLLGTLAGSVGRVLTVWSGARWAEAALSWTLAVMLALAALKLLRRPGAPLLKLGVKPRHNRIGRALARVADEPLLLGAATALLPCAALFGALGSAAAIGHAGAGALFMAAFSTVTGLSMAGAGQLARVASLGRRARAGLAVVMFAGAIVMAMRPLPMLRADGARPSCPLHAGVR
jgi:sulfite exporter TauE/SafE